MQNLISENYKKFEFNKIFFTIKIVAILFCISPTYQYFFKDNTSSVFKNINVGGLILSLALMIVVTFMWLIVDYNRKKITAITLIEIIVMFAICTISIMVSGKEQSYYKFMYIFMVVSYTIEFGIKVGIPVSAASSALLFSLDIFSQSKGVNQYFQSDVALCAMFFVVSWILGTYFKAENEYITYLKEFANIDGLTKLYNHRFFHEKFKQECDEAKEQNKHISLIMIDLDYFKTYNDLFGHQKGDNILREISQVFLRVAPENSTVCRYGGEEFTIILPDINESKAREIAENIRNEIYNTPFSGEELLPNGKLTVSIGVSDLIDNNDVYTSIINRSDAALYRAKYFRKNKVQVYKTLLDQLPRFNENSDEILNTVKSFLTVINSRDMYTFQHTERVVYYCENFADYLKLSKEDKQKLIYSAYLHDLGKINVSKKTLISPKMLSKEEWEEMKKHPQDGADIIRQMKGLDDVATIVEQHHERYDGKGYPHNLSGNQIEFLARMLTLCDSFDAMTAKRPYKTSLSFERAFEEVKRCKGTQFDPELSEKFIKAMNNID